MLENYINYLIQNQNLDGGFGYRENSNSIVETTAFAILALHSHNAKLPEIQKAILWLISMQNSDGGFLLFDNDDSSSPYATALSLIAINAVDNNKYSYAINKAVNYLNKEHNFITNKDLNKFLWGWNEKAFVAIEPTSVIVLAYKLLHTGDKFRISESEKFFDKSICNCGGWTYGFPVDRNSDLSQEKMYVPLKPQLHITAFTLMALQDKPDAFKSNIDVINYRYRNSYCPFTLSLCAMALHCFKLNPKIIVNKINDIMTDDQYSSSIVYFHAMAALANLVLEGKNPLCLMK